MNEWVDERINGFMDGSEGWMNGMDGWMKGLMNGMGE